MRRTRVPRTGASIAPFRSVSRLLVVAAALGASPVRAGGVSGHVEWAYTRSETSGADALDTPSETFVRSFRQRTSIQWERRLFPNLHVLAGGLYELERSRPETDGVGIDARLAKLRPFALVRLRTPEHQADLGYSRSEDRSRIEGGEASSLVRDTVSASLGWLPERLPRTRLYWIRTDDHDGGRTARDATQDSLQLLSDYQPVPQVVLRYRGSRLETSDRVAGTESRSLLHSGRVTFSDAYWDRRVSVNADYNAQLREVETRSRGGGEISLPLYPVAGLQLAQGFIGPAAGIELEDGVVRFDQLSDEGGEGFNHWYRLVIREGEDKPIEVDGKLVRSDVRRVLGDSLKLRQVSAAGDNSAEWELNAANNVQFDMSRFGIEFVASPRHADGIVITGPISENMAEPLQICYDAVPDPIEELRFA